MATKDIDKKLNDLLSVIDMNAIVAYDERTKRILVGGEVLDDSRLSNLKAEADFFIQSDLWKLIYETPKVLAERAMFVNGETLDDMKKGRSMLYTLATQKKIIETFVNKK